MNYDENPQTHVFTLNPDLAVGVLDQIVTATEQTLNEAAATRAWAERSRTGIAVMAGLFCPTHAPGVPVTGKTAVTGPVDPRAAQGSQARSETAPAERRGDPRRRPPERAVIGTRSMVHGLTVIGLAGDVDVATVAELRRQLAPRRSASLPDLAVDLREVEFMDCAVVGALNDARNEVADAGGCLRLAGPGSQVRRILSLCQLEEVFCIYDTLGEATDPLCARHRVARATSSTPEVEARPTPRLGARDLPAEPHRHPGPAAA